MNCDKISSLSLPEYSGEKFGLCVGANGNVHDRTLRSDNLNSYLIEMAKCVASFGRPRYQRSFIPGRGSYVGENMPLEKARGKGRDM